MASQYRFQKALLIFSVTVALIAGGVATVLVVNLLETEYDPISFVNPALVVYEDGTVPTVDGIEGPAISLPDDPDELVFPARWTELNTDVRQVPATFSFYAQSLTIGETVTILEDSPRQPFEPGVVVFNAVSAIPEPIQKAVKTAAQSGICLTVWTNIAEATPIASGGVSAPFFSQNYTIVHPCWKNKWESAFNSAGREGGPI